jgi:hypothetical protein
MALITSQLQEVTEEQASEELHTTAQVTSLSAEEQLQLMEVATQQGIGTGMYGQEVNCGYQHG